MKIKTWLYPLVLFVCTLAVIIAVFFPFYNLMYANDLIRQVWDQYCWFSTFATLDPTVIASTYGISLTVSTFITIAGVFATSYLVLAFTGLVFSAMVILLRVIGIEFNGFAKISKVFSSILLIGTIGFIVSAVLFICLNQSGVVGINTAHVGIEGTFALWTIIGGLILGTIASFLSRRDIMEEDAEKEEKRAKALARKLAKKEKEKEELKKEISKTVTTQTPSTKKTSSQVKIVKAKKTQIKKK